MKDLLVSYWVEFVLSIISGCLLAYCKYISTVLKKRQDRQEALEQGVIAMLHDRLFQSCSFYIKKSYIPLNRAEEIMDNIKMIYNSYKGLGGNGTGTELYERFKALPIEHHDED